MTKLKCWKSTANESNFKRWNDKRKKYTIVVVRGAKGFNLEVYDDKKQRTAISKSFVGKPKAIREAKSYMRKHDKC